MLTFLIASACLLPLPGILAEKKMSCSDPGVPYRGYRNGSCCSYGDRLTYYCEENYELVGVNFIICVSDGNWTASPPHCRASFRIYDRRYDRIYYRRYDGKYVRRYTGTRKPYVPDLKPNSSELGHILLPKLPSTTNSVSRIYLERNTSPVTKSPDIISTPAVPGIDKLKDCFCTYNNTDPNLVAYSGQRKFKYGEKIKKGSTVNFRCRIVGYRRLRGPAELSCRNCTWHSSEFPTCVSPKKGEPIITVQFNHPDDFTFSPSGIRYVKPHVDINITCFLKQLNGLIRLSGPRKELIPTYFYKTIGNTSIWTAVLILHDAKPIDSGAYVCSREGHNISHQVYIKVEESSLCPQLDETEGLSILYTNGRKIHSSAMFHCTPEYRRKGSAFVECMANGEWLGSLASCTDDCVVPTLPNGQFAFKEIKQLRFWVKRHTYKLVPLNTEHSNGTVLYVLCTSPHIFDGKSNASYTPVRCDRGMWHPQPNCLLATDQKQQSSVDPMTSLQTSHPVTDVPVVTSTVLANTENLNKPKTFTGPSNFDDCTINKELGRANLEIFPVKEVYKFGEIAKFICPPRYELYPRIEQAVCLPSGWSDDFPNCVPVSNGNFGDCTINIELGNANLEIFPVKEIYKFGESVNFICPPRYELSPRTEKAKCLPSGWSDDFPKCDRIVNFSDCTINQELGNANLEIFPVREVYEFGESVNFICPPRYELSPGIEKATCLPSGWSDDFPNCVRIGNFGECTIKKELGNANLEIFPVKEVYEFGESVNFICPPRYELSPGIEKATCLPSGWSEHFPNCVRIGNFGDCTINQELGNANLKIFPLKEVYEFGESVIFICPPRYELSPRIYKAICLPSGWSDDFPNCVRIGNFGECTINKELGNANLEIFPVKEVYKFGESVNFICPPRYELSPRIEKATCLPSGWSDDFPNCDRTGNFDDCTINKELVNANLEIFPAKEVYKSGESVNFVCPPRYELSPRTEKATCLPSGWSDDFPNCVPVDNGNFDDCTINKELDNANLEIFPVKEVYKFGEIVKFMCSPRHELTPRTEQVVCLPYGWSNDFPHCTPIHGAV